MDEQTTAQAEVMDTPEPENVQGNLYEFYLLLQRLKAGGMSFDTFLRRATVCAMTRATQK